MSFLSFLKPKGEGIDMAIGKNVSIITGEKVVVIGKVENKYIVRFPDGMCRNFAKEEITFL